MTSPPRRVARGTDLGIRALPLAAAVNTQNAPLAGVRQGVTARPECPDLYGSSPIRFAGGYHMGISAGCCHPSLTTPATGKGSTLSSKAASRIYSVSRKGDSSVRLVRAPNWAQALRHVANDEYHVDVATQDQLVECTQRGIQTEAAGAEPKNAPDPTTAPPPNPPPARMQPTATPGFASGTLSDPGMTRL